MEYSYQDYKLTDDRGQIDIDVIYDLLRETYWGNHRSKETIKLSIDHSLCFSLFHRDKQVGVARVLTDCGVTSYLCDVVLDPMHRSQGLGLWLMERILDHPSIRHTQMLLITRDAQEFYRKLGFETHSYECMVRPIRE